jgi:hypothetical protein
MIEADGVNHTEPIYTMNERSVSRIVSASSYDLDGRTPVEDLAESGRFGTSDDDKRTLTLRKRRRQVADPKPSSRPVPWTRRGMMAPSRSGCDNGCRRCRRLQQSRHPPGPSPNVANFGVQDRTTQVSAASELAQRGPARAKLAGRVHTRPTVTPAGTLAERKIDAGGEPNFRSTHHK